MLRLALVVGVGVVISCLAHKCFLDHIARAILWFPIANPQFRRCYSNASTTTPNDKIARSVIRVISHALNHRVMNIGIV